MASISERIDKVGLGGGEARKHIARKLTKRGQPVVVGPPPAARSVDDANARRALERWENEGGRVE